MDENFNPDSKGKENKNIRFDVNGQLDIVPAPAENRNNKAIIIALISVIIAVSVCIMGVFLSDKKTDDSTDAEVSSEYGAEEYGNVSEHEIITDEEVQSHEHSTLLNKDTADAKPDNKVESTAKPDNSTITAQPSYDKSACETSIRAYFNRYFYYEGMLNNEHSEMAFDGDNFEMITNINGTEISILKIDGKLYFKRTALKQYAQLTDAVMQTLGLSIDKINFDSEDTNYEAMKDCLTEIKTVTFDGKDGVCFRYDKNNNFFKFYFIDNKLVKIETGKANEIRSTFVISVFIPSIPGDMLSLKGYEETGFMSLFADYM